VSPISAQQESHSSLQTKGKSKYGFLISWKQAAIHQTSIYPPISTPNPESPTINTLAAAILRMDSLP
jgi:hypothetical protein